MPSLNIRSISEELRIALKVQAATENITMEGFVVRLLENALGFAPKDSRLKAAPASPKAASVPKNPKQERTIDYEE